MKLYPIDIPSNINLDLLEKYKIHEGKETMIYSNEGLFSIQNNFLKRCLIGDGKYEEVEIEGMSFIADYSKLSYSKEIYKLPFNFDKKTYNIYTYAVNKNAKLKFIIEKINSKIYNMYFSVNEDIRNIVITNDIVTFLSLLK